jgi:hypothetical protein
MVFKPSTTMKTSLAIAEDTPQISNTSMDRVGNGDSVSAKVHLNHGFVFTNVHLLQNKGSKRRDIGLPSGKVILSTIPGG